MFIQLRFDRVISKDALDNAIDAMVSSTLENRKGVTRNQLRRVALKEIAGRVRSVLVLQAGHEKPADLPKPRIYYKDKHNDETLKKADPIKFFKAVYGDFLKERPIYQNELAHIDGPLMKALRNYCANHPEHVLTKYVKPRPVFPKNRVALQVVPADNMAEKALKQIQAVERPASTGPARAHGTTAALG